MNPLRRIFDAIMGPPAERTYAPDDSITAGYPDNEIEAELWRSILERNGIRSAVVGPARLALYGVVDREIRLEVLYRDLTAARELLALGEDGLPLNEPGLAALPDDDAEEDPQMHTDVHG
jgi:hypothetical protein